MGTNTKIGKNWGTMANTKKQTAENKLFTFKNNLL